MKHSLPVRRSSDLRDIARVRGPPDSPLTGDRVVGAQRAAEDHGLIGRLIVESGDFSVESGRRAANVLLSLDRPPTAIFCFSDEMAIGTLAAARSAQISCPDTLSVVGFDDIRSEEHTSELQSLMRISYAVFCLKKKKQTY